MKGFHSRAFRAGSYTILVCLLTLAICVVLNMLADALPESLTKVDVTEQKLFTLSAQSENLVKNLQEDVTVYWVVQAGQEDPTLEQLLNQYGALGSRLHILKRDPDVYPDFLGRYGVSQGVNNSLVVESGERFRYLSYYDIYVYNLEAYYTTGSYQVEFAGEQVLTGALGYVTSERLPILYLTTGHGEGKLSTGYADAVERANFETRELSLLTVEAIPEDAGMVLIHTPDRDFSQEELAVLESYLENGGNLLYISQPPRTARPEKLETLLSRYGITAREGLVVEGNGNYYALGTPHYLLPDLESHAITNPLLEENYYCLLPIAQGLEIAEGLPETVTVSPLLTTSPKAYSKLAGYRLETYEKEPGDLDGPFHLGAASVRTLDDGLESRLVWIGSSGITDDQANAQVSGGNQDLFLNALSWLCDQEQSVTIHAKSLSANYLTMPEQTVSVLSVIVLAVIPGMVLALGLALTIRRRRR